MPYEQLRLSWTFGDFTTSTTTFARHPWVTDRKYDVREIGITVDRAIAASLTDYKGWTFKAGSTTLGTFVTKSTAMTAANLQTVTITAANRRVAAGTIVTVEQISVGNGQLVTGLSAYIEGDPVE